MQRRGLTLIELLAAISILAVVTALAMPAIQSRMGSAKLETAQGLIEAAVLSARAESSRTGEPVVLEHRNRPGGVELTMTTLKSSPPTGSGSDGANTERERAKVSVPAWCQLPDGILLTNEPHRSQSPTRDQVKTTDEPQRIAAFYPDGTAVSAGALYIVDADVSFAISVHAWMGGIDVRPVPKEEGVVDPGMEEPRSTSPSREKAE